MNIAIFEADTKCQEVFQQLEAKIDFYTQDINHAVHEKKAYEAISIFVHSKIDRSVLELLPSLHYIQTRSTGFDHIDLEECKKRGIIVSNVQGYAGPPVAEFAFSLLLNISRKTDIAIARAKEGSFVYKDLLGFELFEKRLGIVGLGTIGKQMARIAHGFGMNIQAYTRHYDEAFCSQYNIEKSNYDKLLQTSDVVMFAVPLTPQTYHMLDIQKAKLLQPHAVVINVARGEVISREAIEYLSDRIYGIGLDVFEGEKELLKNPTSDFLQLIQKSNIRYTPHMAYYTKEALERIRKISVENMKRFMENKKILHRIA
ncbi:MULTISPECIES: NAD(P)-dependent oxidoreductase [unclassified Nitratiruptor]|uniref:NAD(P)-dependent oxidoreductase n=1 Tax=unclassified Nitratiruptor TaxID=2624044 RepID=UPI001915CC9C|nr:MULTISPECIES: NAD(P)-dependent oxidoreductase [unclassified Nitratiruptor]BCD59319.1 D-lactate dehydrogenase [Nitratiruptor sp. YY08-10]BCD63243.1 D-lactate dehydrogenase [Nitratiruptor sp. YY08-14]